jgi:hypothetical protein
MIALIAVVASLLYLGVGLLVARWSYLFWGLLVEPSNIEIAALWLFWPAVLLGLGFHLAIEKVIKGER